MKEKLLFMLIDMNIGGTEKAFLAMLETLPRAKYDITVMLLLKRGGFLDQLPPDVKVLTFENYQSMKLELNYNPKKRILNLVKSGNLFKSVSLLSHHLYIKITKDRRIFFKKILKNYPPLKEEYDIAIAYAGPMDFISYFIVHKVKAHKKIQWIHFDVSKIGFDPHFVKNVYSSFEHIYTVSKEGKEKLEKVQPALKGKVRVFYNQLPKEKIWGEAHSGESFTDSFKGVRILTVGRLSKEKGQDLAIAALSRLKAEGYNVRWYCIGEGNMRSVYEQAIREKSLKKDFILLGAKTNPYPYLKECDLYVQSSRHEGYCLTLAEARIFSKPIVTTCFTGAKEQLRHRQTGLIVDINEESIYLNIKELLDNENLRRKFTEKLRIEVTSEFEENNNSLFEFIKKEKGTHLNVGS